MATALRELDWRISLDLWIPLNGSTSTRLPMARLSRPISALRAKSILAMRHPHCTIAISSC